jgi:ABC-type branched-subunit amino acid transport system ATPase component
VGLGNAAGSWFDGAGAARNELDTAILMVEQNAKEGLAISGRGYVLDQGTVRFENRADQLLDDDEVGRLYLGGA